MMQYDVIVNEKCKKSYTLIICMYIEFILYHLISYTLNLSSNLCNRLNPPYPSEPTKHAMVLPGGISITRNFKPVYRQF